MGLTRALVLFGLIRQHHVRLLHSLLLVAAAVSISACSVTFPVLAGFDAYNEVLRGTGTSNLRGYGYFEIQGEVTKVRCAGEAVVTQRTGGFGCAGQRGRCVFRCDDGRRGEGIYTVTSCGSGFGHGRDSDGNAVWFAFGMSEQEALDRVQRELQIASRRPAPPTAGPGEQRRGTAFTAGTGFFVTTDGYMVTNLHVVEGARLLTVVPNDRKAREARLVAADHVNDIALLKVDMTSQPVPIRDTRGLAKGDSVATVGYPLVSTQGQEAKATFGHVNALSGVRDDVRYLQIDVPIQPGNSGGPLVDARGAAVGIVTARLDELATLRRSGALPQSVNYALKMDYVLPLLRARVHLAIATDERPPVSLPEIIRQLEQSVVYVIAQ